MIVRMYLRAYYSYAAACLGADVQARNIHVHECMRVIYTCLMYVCMSNVYMYIFMSLCAAAALGAGVQAQPGQPLEINVGRIYHPLWDDTVRVCVCLCVCVCV